MEVLEHIPFTLDIDAQTDLMAKLRIRAGSADSEHFKALVEQSRAIARPKAVYDICYVEDSSEDTVTVSGVTFTSRTLRLKLENVERVFPFIATCGREFDGIDVGADDFVKAFWLDSLKQAGLDCSIRYLDEHLKTRFGITKSAAMSPGSADVGTWPIEQQRQLFSLFGDVGQLIGVTLSESCLMLPNKSVSGIWFPTEIDFTTCQLCQRKNCPSRRAPFDKKLKDSPPAKS